MKSSVLFAHSLQYSDASRRTIWGCFPDFDGHHLAAFALGRHGDALRMLLSTLDLIDRNLADEESGRGDKWHLGDFALHTVWRAWKEFPDQIPAELQTRLRTLTTGYRYHDGGMTENHNLLHHAMRLLAGEQFPDARFRDGRSGAEHAAEAGERIRDWCRTFLDHGSSEWGAGLYENVNLLSLCNLFDFAGDLDIRGDAGAVLDRMSREIALNAFAGATAGAARREYGCYRMDLSHSPSRALHALWFGAELPEHALDFVGGVLVAALSTYRPSEETIQLARHPGPLRSSNWNTRPFDQRNVSIPETFRVTTRLPGVQLSGTIVPASHSRYTDLTWFAALGEEAVVFATHPSAKPPGHKMAEEKDDLASLLTRYESENLPYDRHPLWVAGNMPPGMPGDIRPGFWQGHGHAPACWMRDRRLLCLWDLPADDPAPWIHLYLPRHAFDEVRQDGCWIFLKKGKGRLRIWCSAPAQETTSGVWRHCEWRVSGPQAGLMIEIDSGSDWDSFCRPSSKQTPTWTSDSPRLEIAFPEGTIALTPVCRFPDTQLPPRAHSMLHES